MVGAKCFESEFLLNLHLTKDIGKKAAVLLILESIYSRINLQPVSAIPLTADLATATPNSSLSTKLNPLSAEFIPSSLSSQQNTLQRAEINLPDERVFVTHFDDLAKPLLSTEFRKFNQLLRPALATLRTILERFPDKLFPPLIDSLMDYLAFSATLADRFHGGDSKEILESCCLLLLNILRCQKSAAFSLKWAKLLLQYGSVGSGNGNPAAALKYFIDLVSAQADNDKSRVKKLVDGSLIPALGKLLHLNNQSLNSQSKFM